MQNVYVFWDNSNIFHSAQQVAERKEGTYSRNMLRLHFANLMKLAAAGRNVVKAVAVGSVPPDLQALWDRMKAETNINIELYERGASSGKEQAVDQSLQTHMLRAVTDEKEPQIAILLTGDGKGVEEGIGFLADLKRMYDAYWGVEVLSWEHSCNKDLKEWAEENGVFINLNDYYMSVTFLEGSRIASPLSLVSRKRASLNPNYKTKLQLEREDEERMKRENELVKRNEELEKQIALLKYGQKVQSRNRSKRKKR